MTSRTLSPGGTLLRASRVFSMPAPLPKPQEPVSAIAPFFSKSATLVHPIRQSVTAPTHALAKGDWGFKRAFPRRTKRTSTPLLRVSAVDTRESITDIHSAADHSLNLKKFQEMGISLSTPTVRKSATGAMHAKYLSVFEDSIDQTTSFNAGAGGADTARWKYKGPWLAGLSEGEFLAYVQEDVRNRRAEFRPFLRQACADTITKENIERARMAGEPMRPTVRAEDITDDQLLKYTKELRNDLSALYKQIRAFLDLPAPPKANLAASSFFDDLAKLQNRTPDSEEEKDSPYAENGPPKTHPSAGLSYGRTDAITFNHPLYGPQKERAPVLARVIMPKSANTGRSPPILGVGGVAVKAPANEAFRRNERGLRRGGAQVPVVQGLLNIELDKVGGSKVYVNVKKAHIDAKGRIIMQVDTADPECVAVHEGKEGEIPSQLQRPYTRPLGYQRPLSGAAEQTTWEQMVGSG